MILSRGALRLLKVALALGLAVAVWFALAMFTGVTFFPHVANVSPTILGEVSSPAGPLAGTPIRLALRDGNTSCADPSAELSTNGNGRFVFRPVRELHWLMFVMAHRRFRSDVCVKLGGQWQLAKSHEDYTLVDFGPGGAVMLRCSVDSVPGAARHLRCEERRNWDLTKADVDRWLASGSR